MQFIKSFFEGEEPKIRAQIVGFSNANSGIALVGYNEDKVVYSVPLKLYSGVNNPIKIICLNSDQKYINVSNANIQVGLFVAGTENELIIANATNIDSANGVVQIIFTPSELAPLDFGFYEVAVTATDANLNVWPVYIDDNYGSRLTVQFLKGPVLAYANALPVNWTDISTIGVVSQQIDLTNRPMGSTLATLQTNLGNSTIGYTGNILAQGSMVTIPLPPDWGNISSTYYANVSGNIVQSVQGSFAMLRFIADGIDPNKWGNVSQSNIGNAISYSSVRI
jgi:hypothetical protein